MSHRQSYAVASPAHSHSPEGMLTTQAGPQGRVLAPEVCDIASIVNYIAGRL